MSLSGLLLYYVTHLYTPDINILKSKSFYDIFSITSYQLNSIGWGNRDNYAESALFCHWHDKNRTLKQGWGEWQKILEKKPVTHRLSVQNILLYWHRTKFRVFRLWQNQEFWGYTTLKMTLLPNFYKPHKKAHEEYVLLSQLKSMMDIWSFALYLYFTLCCCAFISGLSSSR